MRLTDPIPSTSCTSCKDAYSSRSVDDFDSSGWWWLFDLEPAGIDSCVLQGDSVGIGAALLESAKLHSLWKNLKASCNPSSGCSSGGGVYLATYRVFDGGKLEEKEVFE